MVLAHFCITKKAKTKPKQKKISTTKKNTPQKGKEFAYSLCRLQKNKRKAKFNLRKSCFRYGFIRWISPHTYILYIYILYIFSLHKRLLLRANEKSRKKWRNLLGYACGVLESCLIYYTRVELPPPNLRTSFCDMHTGQIELWGVCKLQRSPLTTHTKDDRGTWSSRIILLLSAFVAPNLRLLKQNVDNTLIYYAKGGQRKRALAMRFRRKCSQSDFDRK